MKKKYKVLHLDNNRVFTNLFGELLEEMDIEYHPVHSPQDALMMIEKISPHLLITDLIGGNDYDVSPRITFIKDIYNKYQVLRIMVLSTRSDQQIKDELRNYIVHYEIKTFRPSQFKERLLDLLKEYVKINDKINSIIKLNVVDFQLYQDLNKQPELITLLNWRIFEELLADILEKFGYEIELKRGTKDGGVDIFAIRRSDPFGEHRYLLQAKQWSNRVGVEPVRQLMFLHSHHRATKSCLATTAKFTKGAWELAEQYKWQLELRDYDGIHDWISKVVDKKIFEI